MIGSKEFTDPMIQMVGKLFRYAVVAAAAKFGMDAAPDVLADIESTGVFIGTIVVAAGVVAWSWVRDSYFKKADPVPTRNL